ncbi:MAG: sel1 repeat family protein, partial [Kiritimatiellae bacterium]|nr:sel1 repeat family protein [Kiritimatiellia bacterium]
MKRFALFACICWVGLGLLTDTLAEAQHADSDAALDTIAIINQINYAVEVIRTYNNVIALEEEYEKISADNLNLNCIRDEESLQLIRDILNTLNSMRMNDRARKWYRHVLTRDLKGAKINGMAKMATTVTSSLVNGSGGFWSRLGQVATATALAGVESIADYKKAKHEFQGQFEDKEFELDTEKLNKLHEMNDKLLESQWKLVQKYHLDDRLRVTGKEVKSLVSSLKTSDRKNAFRQLKPMQRKFEVYPIYWYYRAAMALSVEEYKDAINSCEHFDRINRGLFRTDQMAASTAMIKIAAMMKQRHTEKQFEPSEKETLKKGLEIICTQNYNSENPDESIFCASVYLFALNDVESASTVLDALMSKLATASQDELREYCDLFTRPKEPKKEAPPNMAYLAQCRMLRLAIDQKKEQKINVERLKEICERETTCSLEKLFYFGELRIKDMWEVAKKDVEKINLTMSGDRVVVEIPVAWFLLGKLGVSVEMMKGPNVVQTLIGDDSKRSHVMSSPNLFSESKDMAYVRIVMPVQKGALVGCDGARLHLSHVSWPVDLVYAPSKPLNNGDEVFVPVRVERFMGKDMKENVMLNPIEEAKKKFEELKRLADAGDLNAQVELAICYFDGTGVTADGHEAVRWVRNVAEHGHAAGQFMLGTVYERGLGGVAVNAEEAVKWFRMSAAQDFELAQLELGRCYRNGFGVETDTHV